MNPVTENPSTEAGGRPAPEQGTPRADFVRDLYALGQWYLDHPAHPLPRYLQIGHFLDDPAALVELGEQLGHKVYSDPGGAQFHYDMPGVHTQMQLVVSTIRAPERPL